MMVVIKRGLVDVRELKEKEKDKTEERIQTIARIVATNIEQIEFLSGIDWSLPSDFALDPSLLADLGILGNVETPCDIQSGS